MNFTGLSSLLLGLLVAFQTPAPAPAPTPGQKSAPDAPAEESAKKYGGRVRIPNSAPYPPPLPQEWFEVERVVDGDTIWIDYRGKTEKLRLMCVDTEEKLGTDTGSASKPGTVFGEECALWAQQFFSKEVATPPARPKVGLYFPDGREQRDAYGRLLCHVILPDGRDFNLILIELGKSPYFNKYGNAHKAHATFAAAQEKARREQLGIWNPATNQPKTEGAPSAKRPYDLLLPWWDARAAAIDGFRARAVAEADGVCDAENPIRAKRACEYGKEVDVFGTPERLFEEDDGSQTILLRCEDKSKALRVSIPAAARAKFASLQLERLQEDYRQNYFWVRGTPHAGARGCTITVDDVAALRIAEPAYPKPATPAVGR